MKNCCSVIKEALLAGGSLAAIIVAVTVFAWFLESMNDEIENMANKIENMANEIEMLKGISDGLSDKLNTLEEQDVIEKDKTLSKERENKYGDSE